MDSIIIYNSTGTILYNDIPVTSSAELVQELMRSDYVQLSWRSATNEIIPAGAYIVIDGEHYSILESYSPEQRNEREWEYKPQFVSQFFRGTKAPFFMYTTIESVTTKEADWTLTDGPSAFMERLKVAFENELGLKYTYAVDNNLQVASATLQFNCVDIVTGCNQIADAFKTELWLEKFSTPDANDNIGCLHLGKASFGTAKVLEVGNNIKVPSKSTNAEFFNRFYVFGSSRNITQDYQGATVNNIAVKRLTLNPNDYPNGYIDFSNGGPVYSKILQFDDVYPSATDLVVMNIRTRTRYVLDENTSKPVIIGGTEAQPVYDTYFIWYVQLKRLVGGSYIDFPFSESMVLPGLVPSLHFNSGPLAGREFEVIYHNSAETVQDSADPTPFQILAGDFEIKYQDENGFILPAMTGLVPQTDNLVVLFNVKMPDAYEESAQDRLATVALEEINKNYLNTTTGEAIDKNEYQAASDPTVFYDNDPELVIGGKILYKNGSYQKETRITSLTKRLDLPCYQNIVFGDNIVKGNIEELKEEAVSANRNIDLLTAISKSTSDITAAYERTHQLILKQLADQGSFWLKYEQNINGVIHRSVKLNPIYDGVLAEGYGVFAGSANFTPGGGGGGSIAVYTPPSLEGTTFDQASEADTFNAYTIQSLHTRIKRLEQNPGGVTSVAGLTGAVSASDLFGALGLGNAATKAVGSVANGNTGLVTGGDVYSFVNSSVATATATFRGTNTTATTEADFLTWADALPKTLNDYVFWKTTDSYGNTLFKRYKYGYDGTEAGSLAWRFEYDLNNSSFTATQWASINSGITSQKVGDYDTIKEYFVQGVLDASHIPTLATSKISGLDTALSNINGDITALQGRATELEKMFIKVAYTVGQDTRFYLKVNPAYFDGITAEGFGVFSTSANFTPGGGGGGDVDLAQVWQSLQNAASPVDFTSTLKFHQGHLPTPGTGLAYTVDANGLVTGIGIDNNYKLPTYTEWESKADASALLSLQAQVDSVSSRSVYDELSISNLYADMAVGTSAYFGTIYGNLSGTATGADNADKLDGVHASGLFTELTTIGGSTNLYITIGGTRISGTVYAYYDGDGEVISSNMATIGASLRSIQAQVDSVALKSNFEELTVSYLNSDIVSAASLRGALHGNADTATSSTYSTYATNDSAGENITSNMTIVGASLRSLQAQIDSVSTKRNFEELIATYCYSDVLSVGAGIKAGGEIYSVTGVSSPGYGVFAASASSSDERLKDNIESISPKRAWDVLMRLKPREWVWNSKYFKGGEHCAGFVAQEVMPILPFSVIDNNEYLHLTYDVFHGFEVAGLQDHELRIKALERKVEILTNNS